MNCQGGKPAKDGAGEIANIHDTSLPSIPSTTLEPVAEEVSFLEAPVAQLRQEQIGDNRQAVGACDIYIMLLLRKIQLLIFEQALHVAISLEEKGALEGADCNDGIELRSQSLKLISSAPTASEVDIIQGLCANRNGAHPKYRTRCHLFFDCFHSISRRSCYILAICIYMTFCNFSANTI